MPPAQKLISGQRRCCGGVARGGSICRLVSAVSDTSCRCSVSSSCWTDSDRRAEYCDDRVCISACLSVSISSPDIHIRSLPDFLCTWHTYGRGSVLLGWRRDTLLTSGLMYYMIFAHNPRQLSVVAQIKKPSPLGLGSRRLYILCWRELAGAGYCRQCRRRPAILLLQLWQGCQVCVKISAQRLP